MKNSIKLIALDMDGTLLDNEQNVSSQNKEAIKLAKQKGIPTVLSTGRSLLTCREYAESLELSSFLVTSNGSEIWDSSFKLVDRNLIEHAHIEKLWELKQKYNIHFWASTTERLWREEFPDKIVEHEWLKFGFDIPDDSIREAVLGELQESKQLEITNSSPTNIEINAVGINKAKALMKVCERLNITMDNVIAMGDSLNDIAMIEEAGVGVAMGNAQEIVKEKADWITSPNIENGVAKAIHHWVLS